VALLLPAPGLGVLQVGLGEEGDPFWKMRVKQLGKLLKRAQTLVKRIGQRNDEEGCGFRGLVGYLRYS
jgi:hypothetical protein